LWNIQNTTGTHLIHRCSELRGFTKYLINRGLPSADHA
jgi:hypothetical protein